MRHLLIAGRRLKLLGDDVAENLERAPALFVRKRCPQLLEAQPLNRREFRRKKGASWVRGMTILLDSRSDRTDTNRPASGKQKVILRAARRRVDSGELW
jgi:hypothetical protein